jgi:hypothetical protein
MSGPPKTPDPLKSANVPTIEQDVPQTIATISGDAAPEHSGSPGEAWVAAQAQAQGAEKVFCNTGRSIMHSDIRNFPTHLLPSSMRAFRLMLTYIGK